MSGTLLASDLGFKGIRPKLGLIMPEDDCDTGLLLGVGADMGTITKNLRLAPFLTYWNSGYDEYDLDLSLSNIQLGADVHYMFPSVHGLYAGGGLSINLLSVDYPVYVYNSDEVKTESDSETELGIGFLGGYEMMVGKMKGFGELKFNMIDELDTLELLIGIHFDMR